MKKMEINGVTITEKVYHGSKVLTVTDIDRIHKTYFPEVQEKLYHHMEKFVENVDFYYLTDTTYCKNHDISIKTLHYSNRYGGVKLFTKSGYQKISQLMSPDVIDELILCKYYDMPANYEPENLIYLQFEHQRKVDAFHMMMKMIDSENVPNANKEPLIAQAMQILSELS